MSLMIFIFVCFSGLSIMFFFILRGQEKIHSALREELAMMRAHMQQMDAKISGEPMAEQTHKQGLQYATPHSAQSNPLPQTDTLNRENPSHRPEGPDTFDRFAPPESLSMDAPTASTARSTPSNGLDLHFDPQQDFRR